MAILRKIGAWIVGLFAPWRNPLGETDMPLPRPQPEPRPKGLDGAEEPSVLFEGERPRLIATAEMLIVRHSVTADCLMGWMRLGAILSDHGIRPGHLRFLEPDKLKQILGEEATDAG